MNAQSRHEKTGTAERPNRVPRCGSARALLPALIALGGGSLLAAGPAAALQLGEMRVQSNLGQPLRASIAYALNPGEHIRSHCIRLRSGRTASGLPGIHDARVSLRENVIRLTGRAALNDPLVALTLNIDCPGTANISREYTAFIDPAATAGPAALETAASEGPVTSATSARGAGVAGGAARTPSTAGRPVAAGTYRVQPGDSLSAIAARIAGRRTGLWDTVDALFAANPGAFIDGNRDLLLAGSELVIPTAVLEPGTRAPVSARAAQPSPSAANATSLEAAPVQPAPPAPAAEAAGATSTAAGTQTGGQSASAGPATATPAAKPRQGDVSLGTDGPFVSPIEPAAVSSAAQASATPPRPAAAQAPPAANHPAFSTNENAGGSRTWLMWLGGSGAALILALVLLGRRFRARFGSAAPSLYGRRRTDADSDDTTVVARADPDASSLEVDLDDAGDSGDIDLAQEFGYTMSGDTGAEDRFGSTAILESEILPSDDTGEYDLSMIVDATQHTPHTEDTTRDLRAIPVDERDGDDASDGTLSREVDDYSILEQDYQDELTATQALSEELARAAREMSLEIEGDAAASPLPTADDGIVDATAAMPAGVDAENASAPTVEMPRTGSHEEAPSEAEDDREDTRAGEDLTSTIADAENDPTAQTDETKKLRAS